MGRKAVRIARPFLLLACSLAGLFVARGWYGGNAGAAQVGQVVWLYSTQDDCRGRVKVKSLSVMPVLAMT